MAYPLLSGFLRKLAGRIGHGHEIESSRRRSVGLAIGPHPSKGADSGNSLKKQLADWKEVLVALYAGPLAYRWEGEHSAEGRGPRT